MAKRKIIWSNIAKKKLYAILESDFRKRNDKVLLRGLFGSIINTIRPLSVKPGLGRVTSDVSVLGLRSGGLIIYYGVTQENIIILTISGI